MKRGKSSSSKRRVSGSHTYILLIGLSHLGTSSDRTGWGIQLTDSVASQKPGQLTEKESLDAWKQLTNSGMIKTVLFALSKNGF